MLVLLGVLTMVAIFMGRAALVALAVGIGFLGLITSGAFGSEAKALPVSLVEVGYSFTTEDGGKSMPLFAVMLGNTAKAENASLYWTKFFGLYATNGTFWVHPVDQPADVWKRVIYHRPGSMYEAAVFFEDQETWRFEETDKAHMILPAFVRALPSAELAKVEFVLTYFDGGGTNVYLKSRTPPESARALFETIEIEKALK
ncbi:MAG: hypothetical protein Q8Q41_00770 [bacterium]|nr:hypothetical protein [bacterium]